MPSTTSSKTRVVVIGAGVSGIYCGIRIPQRLPDVELVIYDKNEGIGGTWFENRYAGCACDIPAHSYQYSFEPNKDWSKFYAPAAEICKYWSGAAKKYGATRFIKLNHRVVEAKWDQEECQWTLKVQVGGKDPHTFETKCNVLIDAMGGLNNWKWPDIPGRDQFKGHMVHSANWDENYNYKGKKVAVIGAGSSAIQIVPALQPIVSHMDTYVRSATWIAMPFAGDEVVRRNPTGGNISFSEEERKRFHQDDKFYHTFRTDLEKELNSVHEVTQKNSNMSLQARGYLEKTMKEKLSSKPEIADTLIPTFHVGCRRLTPGPGYLEALTKDNVSFRNTKIKRFVATGIETEDSVVHEADAIICATGFDTSFRPSFPIYGKQGKVLGSDWTDHPEAYLSLAVDGFPNYFKILGPNAGVGSGSLTIILERVGDYIIKVIDKMQRERIKSVTVKTDARKDFNKYIDCYFPKTVFGDKCRTWYKAGKIEGRVSGLWPGSCLHAIETLEHPRWEDYEYTYNAEHRFSWLGDGWSRVELNKGNLAYYLEDVDVPPVYEE